MHLWQRNKHLTWPFCWPIVSDSSSGIKLYVYKTEVQMEGLSSQTVGSALSWYISVVIFKGGRFLRIWMNDLHQKKFKFFCHQHPSMILSKSRPCWAPPTQLPYLLPLLPLPHSSGQDDLKTEDRTVIEGCDSQHQDKSRSPNKLFARRYFIYYRNRIKGKVTKGNSWNGSVGIDCQF